MMNDGGKRVFLAVLALAFGLLLYMCVDGRDIIRWTADVAYSRGNEDLSIERLGMARSTSAARASCTGMICAPSLKARA